MGVPRILYDNALKGRGLWASSVALGSSVVNLTDARPYTFFTPGALPVTITRDYQTAKACDTACIVAHNLASMGCDVQIRGSTDGFAASDVLVASVTPSSDGPVWQAFASVSYRHWRLRIDGPGAPALDLDFAGTKTLPAGVTFARADAATCASYWDASGVMQTAAANVARFDHDPLTGESLGLRIEESRTNLLLNSAALATQSVTTAATAYTLSFYGTGTVTLSGTSTSGPLVGTHDQVRQSLTFTPTAGTLTLTVSGSVKYANLEAGSFATSWISTAGTSRTRAADVATMTSTAFSSWYNATEGALAVRFRCDGLGGSGFPCVAHIGFGTTGNRGGSFTINDATGDTVSWNIYDNTPTYQGVPGGVAVPRGTEMIVAGSYKANDSASSISGGIFTDTSVALPSSLDKFAIGAQVTGSSQLNGTIARITYFAKRLTNAQLQWLTAADRGTVGVPSVGVAMIGAALVFPCGLEAPFDPRGRKVDGRKVNNDNGQPLGSFVDYEKWEASIRLRAISWIWIRSTWEPAWVTLRSEPFVFAWDPDNYASEARLVTADGEWDAPHSPGSLCDLSFKLRGDA